MRPHQQKGHGPGCLLLLLITAGLFVYSAVRYFNDRSAYLAAYALYVKGDCATALPEFERISSLFRPVDFGRLGWSSQHLESECADYLDADSRGVPGLYEFASHLYPESLLIPFAKEAAGEELESINADSIHLGETCALKEALIQNGWIANPAKTLPRLDYACANESLAQGDPESALKLMVEVLERYPNSIYAAWSLEEIRMRIEFCMVLDKIAPYPVILNHVEVYPQKLQECGSYFVEQKDYRRAVEAFESLMQSYPSHPGMEEVQKRMAEALIRLSKTSRTMSLRAPDGTGYGAEGSTKLVFQNDSPHPIRIVLYGPEIRIVEMDLCGGCGEYAIMGPVWCPGKGPKVEFELKPGEYEVFVEVTEGAQIVASAGDWVLGERNTYTTCYFVVNR